jgi:hypothetical protein
MNRLNLNHHDQCYSPPPGDMSSVASHHFISNTAATLGTRSATGSGPVAQRMHDYIFSITAEVRGFDTLKCSFLHKRQV